MGRVAHYESWLHEGDKIVHEEMITLIHFLVKHETCSVLRFASSQEPTNESHEAVQ